MSDMEIAEKVKDIVSDKLDVPREEVEESKNFINDLKADSLALVELGMAFEDNFGISIPDEDYEKLKTVGDAINGRLPPDCSAADQGKQGWQSFAKICTGKFSKSVQIESTVRYLGIKVHNALEIAERIEV